MFFLLMVTALVSAGAITSLLFCLCIICILFTIAISVELMTEIKLAVIS